MTASRNFIVIGTSIVDRPHRSLGGTWLVHRDDGMGRRFTYDEACAIARRMNAEIPNTRYNVQAIPTE